MLEQQRWWKNCVASSASLESHLLDRFTFRKTTSCIPLYLRWWWLEGSKLEETERKNGQTKAKGIVKDEETIAEITWRKIVAEKEKKGRKMSEHPECVFGGGEAQEERSLWVVWNDVICQACLLLLRFVDSWLYLCLFYLFFVRERERERERERVRVRKMSTTPNLTEDTQHTTAEWVLTLLIKRVKPINVSLWLDLPRCTR